MYAYSLTGLTGRKKNTDRTMVVATVEVNRFTFIVVISAILAGIPVAVAVGLLIGTFSSFWWLALGIPVLFAMAGVIFVDQRSKKGLQLRRYQSLAEGRSGKKLAETILVCGVPLQVPELRMLTTQFRTRPQTSSGASIAIGTSVKERVGKVSLFDA